MVSREILRIKAYNHLAVLLSLILVFVLIICFLWYVKFERDALSFFGVFILIYALPTFYLHIEYWLENRGESYEVRSDGLTRWKSGQEVGYSNNEIDRIEIYMSPAMYKRSSFHLLGFEAYHYAKVVLKNGEELIITCLLSPKLDRAFKVLRNVPIERKRRLFNSLR